MAPRNVQSAAKSPVQTLAFSTWPSSITFLTPAPSVTATGVANADLTLRPPSESSLASHWRNLRDGVRTVIEHPQGYGLGNAGVVAKRTLDPDQIKGGESTYVELGIDIGIAGLAAFVLWSAFVLLGLLRKETWVAAAFAAVLLLGLQTDVIGVHWLAVAVWAAAGMALGWERVKPAPETGTLADT